MLTDVLYRMIKTRHSSLQSPFVDNSHAVDRTESFRVIYCIPTTFSHRIRSHQFHIAEATGIADKNLNLCIHKKSAMPPFLS